MKKKIFDDKGRMFGVVSFIDIIVLIIVIVVVAVVMKKINVRENPLTTSNTVSIRYSVKVPAIRYTTATHFSLGDRIYNDSGQLLGTVRGIEILPAEQSETKIDGTYVMITVPERYDVNLDVEAQCSFSNGRYYADRTFELNANAEYRMMTKFNDFRGTIMMIGAG